MIPSSLNTRLLPGFPPLCFDIGEDQLPPQRISTLWPGVKMGRRSEWEKRLDAVWQQAALQSGCLPSWGKIWNIAQCLTKCCVSPPSVYPPCPMHSFSVLSWSFVTRTVCATHTSGSAVEGMAVLCTISLRDKLSAIHWGNYVSKHTRQSQCYTEQSLKTLMEWLVAS